MIAPRSYSEAVEMGLSASDWQEVSDFDRFLRISDAPPGCGFVHTQDRAYAWLWYMQGVCGAPPLMWEGDDN